MKHVRNEGKRSVSVKKSDRTEESSADRQGIRVLERFFGILSYLAGQNDYAGIKEIAEATGLSRTTVHRILATCEENYVVLKDGIGRYRIGPKSLVWANSYQQQTGLAKFARQHLKELLRDVGETVNLFIYEKGEAFYLEKMHTYNASGLDSRIGSRLELYSTSAGRAILAALPAGEFDAYLSSRELLPRTRWTIVDRDAFNRLIEESRKKGYAEENQENEEGVRCIGAAILGKDGYPVGAVSISGPVFRLTDDKVERVGKRVFGTARLISYQLGYSTNGGHGGL
ncbi:MAG: IclR family transcriptional regulator [Synergistales bacterium]|jgi:IclR family acetate operon transcriptional repressor|nr:IclR family transcriptional regulator [Synergistales bacterium]